MFDWHSSQAKAACAGKMDANDISVCHAYDIKVVLMVFVLQFLRK